MASNKISPEEANARVLAGEPIIFADAHNPKAWASSGRKIPGALRGGFDAWVAAGYPLETKSRAA